MSGPHTKGALVQAAVYAVPYPDQIKDIDLDSEADSIRFNWRGTSFRISTTGHTEEIDNGMLRGSNIAILLGQLVRFGLARQLENAP